MPVFIWLTVEKSLSTVQLVIGRVTRARRRRFILGTMSLGHVSSTSTSDGNALSAVIFLFSCCTNTSCSTSYTAMKKCVCVFSPKVFDPGKQAAAALINPYVSALKWVFSSMICLSGVSFYIFFRSELSFTGDVLPTVDSSCLSPDSGNFLFQDPVMSQLRMSCFFIRSSVSVIRWNPGIILYKLYV